MFETNLVEEYPAAGFDEIQIDFKRRCSVPDHLNRLQIGNVFNKLY